MGIVFLVSLLAVLAAANMTRLGIQIAAEQWGIDFLWRSVHLLAGRTDPYAAFVKESGSAAIVHGAPNYPVAGLASMLPLALVSEETARWIWLFVNIGCSIGIFILLQKRFPLRDWVLVCAVLAFAASAPLRIALLNSQTPLYVLFLYLLSLHFSPGKPWLSGLLLAVSLTKYSLTLPLAIWFGLRRERVTSLVWSAVWQFLFISLAAVWTRTGFADMLLGPVRLTAAGGVTMKRAAADLFSISHHAGVTSLVIPAIIAMVCLTVSYVAMLARSAAVNDTHCLVKKQNNECLQLAFLVVLSCLVFFHLPYDHVVLLIPLWYGLRVLAQLKLDTLMSLSTTGLVILLWLPDGIWQMAARFLPPLERIGSLWWQLGLSELARFSALILLVSILAYRLFRNDSNPNQNTALPSNEFVPPNAPMLVIDPPDTSIPTESLLVALSKHSPQTRDRPSHRSTPPLIIHETIP
jgi:hypothetical protein